VPEARIAGFDDAAPLDATHADAAEATEAAAAAARGADGGGGAAADCRSFGWLVLEALTALPLTETLDPGRVAEVNAHLAAMVSKLPELVKRLDSRAGRSMGVWEAAVEAGAVRSLHGVTQRCLEPNPNLRATMAQLLPEMERLRTAAEPAGVRRGARKAAAGAAGGAAAAGAAGGATGAQPWSSHWPPASAQPQANQSVGECVVCLEVLASHVLVPCGHCCVCDACSDAVLKSSAQCPVCQLDCREAVRVFLV
jgi:hypothetical protein